MPVNNKKIAQKLQKYSFSAIALIGFIENSRAQMVHTEIEPDIVRDLNSPSFAIDLNHDGEDEIFFELSSSIQYYYDSYGGYAIRYNKLVAHIDPQTRLLADEYAINNYYEPLALSASYDISENKYWLFGTEQILFSNLFSLNYYNWLDFRGFWGDDDFQFLGIRLRLETGLHFGWIRMKADVSDMSYTISDFAYNAHAGEKIISGQLSNNFIDIHTEQSGENLLVFLPEFFLDHETSLQLYNTAGQLVFKNSFSNEPTIFISISNIPSGIYVIKATDGNMMRTKKIIIR